MSGWLWTERGVVPLERAQVSAADRGLLLGEGVYETCEVVAGIPFALRRHLLRLRRSAAQVGLTVPWSDEVLRAASEQAVRAWGGEPGSPWPSRSDDHTVPGAPGSPGPAGAKPRTLERPGGDRPAPAIGRLRITVTGGSGPLGPARADQEPTLLIATGPSRLWPATAAVALSPWRLNERSPLVGAKSTSFLEHLLWLADAHRRGADEAVLENTTGALAEGSTSNVFLVVDGKLCTPSLTTGCLAGVTRELVAELVAVEERDDLTADDLRGASEAFLTSSTRGVHPIATVDGMALPDTPGPATRGAAAAFDSLRARSIDP